MTASVPKRVFPLESPLTARAGPYMSLQPEGHSDHLLCPAQLPSASDPVAADGLTGINSNNCGPQVLRAKTLTATQPGFRAAWHGFCKS
jgi:hypothetical protein